MTDKYQNEHDSSDSYVEGHVGEQQDVWGDQNPPADDFADLTEEASVQVEGDEQDGGGASAGQDQQPAKKKSSMLLPVAVGVAGLIFLGGMMYMQFFSGPDIPPAPSVAQNPVMPLAAQQAPVQPAATPAAAQPFDPLTVKQADGTAAPIAVVPPVTEQPKGLAGIPSPVLQSDTVLPTQQPDVTALVPPTTEMPSPAVVPVAGAAQNPVVATTQNPSAGSGNLPMPVKSGSETGSQMPPIMTAPAVGGSVAPSANPVVAAAPSSGVDQAMKDRVEDLQRTVDRLTQQLERMNGAVASLHNAPQVPTGLDERLGKLEQELVKIQQNVPAAVSPARDKNRVEAGSVARSDTKAASLRRTTSKASSVKPVKKTARVEAKSKMVLRAAAPGEAWVAPDALSSDLKAVRVGDHVAGIGEVTAIRQDDKGWLLQGTKGTLR